MEQEKALALRELINDAFKTYNALISEKTREGVNLEAAKVRFTSEQFALHYNAFIEELNNNILEYKNYEIVKEYIKACFHNFRKNEAHSLNYFSDILNKNYEIRFLTTILSLRTEYYHKISVLKDDSHYENTNCKLFIHFKNLIETKTDSIVKPEFYNIFIFEDLICYYKSVDEIQDSIKEINDKLFFFKQWQIENDEKIETENGIKYKYSDEYFPNFEALCQLELDRLYKKLEIENLIEETYQPPVRTESEKTQLHYRWNLSDTDLLELITALYHSNSIKRKDNRKITRKELMIYFQEIFDTELKHAESKLSHTSDRKKTLTPYLDKLKNAFETFVEEKDDKQRERR